PTHVSKKRSSMDRSFSTAPVICRSVSRGRRSSSPSRSPAARRRPQQERLAMNKASALVALCVAPLCAETFVLTNARIVPVSTPVIERGAVVVQDGKIAAVGAQIKPPAGAKKIDATGLTVYPGMIDGY